MNSLQRAAPAAVAFSVIAVFFASLWLEARQGATPVSAPEEPPKIAGPTTQEIAPPDRGHSSVAPFLAFVGRGTPATLPLDHSYTAEGIRALASAIEALDDSALARDRARRLRAAADEMQVDAHSLRHADLAREAFELGTRALLAIGDPPVPADAGRALGKAAREIRPADPLRIQSRAVGRYFGAAGAFIEAAS